MVHRNYRHSRNIESEKDRYVKYRSTVSNVSFESTKYNTEVITKTNNWSHIGGNILRLPPLRKKFTLVSKVLIGAQDHGIHCVSVCPKGRYVALGMSTGELQVRRLSTLAQGQTALCLRKPSPNVEINSSITCLRFVPKMDNILFCSDITGTIGIFDKEKVCSYVMTKENNEINTIDVNGSGTTVISGGKDAVLRIYDTTVGKLILSNKRIMERTLYADPKQFHQLRIYCIKFDPENYNVFFSGGIDGYVKMWDLREGLKGVRTINGPYIRGDALDLWGDVLLTGSWRSSKGLDLWHTPSGQQLENLIASNRSSSLNAEFYECVRFFNGGRDGTTILAGGSGTGRFEIYSIMNRRIEFAVKVSNTVKSIGSSPSAIICGGLDGFCRVVRYNRIEDE